MRAITSTLATLLATVTLAGCFGPYKSFYEETNHQLKPKPVAPAKVKVVKSRNDLTSKFTELGIYRGSAPTVKEAMDVAKQTCGNAGADFYILNVEPFQSGNAWKIDGVCAAKG